MGFIHISFCPIKKRKANGTRSRIRASRYTYYVVMASGCSSIIQWYIVRKQNQHGHNLYTLTWQNKLYPIMSSNPKWLTYQLYQLGRLYDYSEGWSNFRKLFFALFFTAVRNSLFVLVLLMLILFKLWLGVVMNKRVWANSYVS